MRPTLEKYLSDMLKSQEARRLTNVGSTATGLIIGAREVALGVGFLAMSVLRVAEAMDEANRLKAAQRD